MIDKKFTQTEQLVQAKASEQDKQMEHLLDVKLSLINQRTDKLIKETLANDVKPSMLKAEEHIEGKFEK